MHTAELPKLYNENVFHLLMDYEIKRSQRYVSPVVLLRIAIVLNDPHPHELESMPSALANLLNSRLRAADLPARIGNEYAVLLPATDETGGRAVCQRILNSATGTHTTTRGLTTRLALCIGMTSHLGGPTLQSETLLWEAETALTAARAQGPQTFVVFSNTN